MARIIYKGDALDAHNEDKATTHAARRLIRTALPGLSFSCTTNKHGGSHVLVRCGGSNCGPDAQLAVREVLAAAGVADVSVAHLATCDNHGATA
jgi:ribosomal protein S5